MQNLNMNQFTKRYIKTKDKLLASQHKRFSFIYYTEENNIHDNFLQYSMTDNPKHAHSPKLLIAAGQQVSVS